MAKTNAIEPISGALTTPQGALTNPALVYLATLAPTGRRTMGATLSRVAAMLGGSLDSIPWHEMRYEHVQAIRTKLGETLAPATVNKYLSAIRGVMREAWALGLMPSDDYQRAVTVRGVTGQALPAGRALGGGELGAIMAVCAQDPSPAGARDAAIIALAYAGGLRRAELASLTLADLTEDDGETISLQVLGKRHKERMIYLDNGAASAMRDWLTVRGPDAGALFFAGRKGGRMIQGQSMTDQAIRDVVIRRAEAAGVENVSPHDLRRSFVSDLLDAGIDIATVANMAGHSSIETTRRYDRRGERAKQQAARALHVPYSRRNGCKNRH